MRRWGIRDIWFQEGEVRGKQKNKRGEEEIRNPHRREWRNQQGTGIEIEIQTQKEKRKKSMIKKNEKRQKKRGNYILKKSVLNSFHKKDRLFLHE